MATADMELRGVERNLPLSGLAGVKGHHNRSREAPNHAKETHTLVLQLTIQFDGVVAMSTCQTRVCVSRVG